MNEHTDVFNAVFAKRLTNPDKLIGQKITSVFTKDRELIIVAESGQWLHVQSYISHGWNGDDDTSTICFDKTDVDLWLLRCADVLSETEYDEQTKHNEKYTTFCREQSQKDEQIRRRNEYLRLKKEFEGD